MDIAGTPLEDLRELLLELGALCGCEGEFRPQVSCQADGLVIEVDGPDASARVELKLKDKAK